MSLPFLLPMNVSLVLQRAGLESELASLARLLFTARGRIGPSDFWLAFGILFIGGLLALAIPRIGWALWLATAFPWTCVYAKRLHDLNHSAWVQLVAYAVNFGLAVAGLVLVGWSLVSPFIAPRADMTSMSMPAVIGVLLLVAGTGMFNIIWWVWLGLSPGEDGENRFGPPPSEPILRISPEL